MKPLCIYHGNCADGFTAAWAVYRGLGEDDVEFVAGIYGQEPPDVAGRDVIMVDFSYKRPVLDKMSVSACSILILDHHKTAAADLAGILRAPNWEAWRAAAWNHRLSANVRTVSVFDMERSGAQIAWDYFNPLVERPHLVNYVGDRDLWKFELPQSREVNAFVFAHEYTFENWDNLDRQMRSEADVQEVAEIGGILERQLQKDINEVLATASRFMVLGGYRVPVANLPATRMVSDATNKLAIGFPFAASYFDRHDARVFSLRSHGEGLDVSEIAKAYGGGGHKNAAGFMAPIGWEGDALS